MDEFVHGPRNDWTCRCGALFPCPGWAAQQTDLDAAARWATLQVYATDAPPDVLARMRDLLWETR